jgi:hypothetical protein
MTEAEWLACEDTETMLECLVKAQFPDAEPGNWGRGERKKRLFVYACLRRTWSLLPPEYKNIVAVFERVSDGAVGDETRHADWLAAESVRWEHDNLLFALGYDDIGLLCSIAAGIAARHTSEQSRAVRETQTWRPKEHQEQTAILRDIFGNPFRSVQPGHWITPAAVSVARDCYDRRDFTALPLLADLLEEAGCPEQSVLDHCRQPGEHVRGCWVVDLILGKS